MKFRFVFISVAILLVIALLGCTKEPVLPKQPVQSTPVVPSVDETPQPTQEEKQQEPQPPIEPKKEEPPVTIIDHSGEHHSTHNEEDTTSPKVNEKNETTPPSIPEPPVPKDFWFGIEYAVPGLGGSYADTDLHVTKPTVELLLWMNIQPTKDSPYNWYAVDNHIREYQDAGFTDMQMLISAQSTWASRDAINPIIPRDTRPKPEYEDEYQKFVNAAVERYDRDGIDDMPGLKYPINEWGVEREFTGYFPGNGDQYVQILQLAYPSIKEANPNAKVMTVAFVMAHVFQGNPNSPDVKKTPKVNGKPYEDVMTVLDATDYYDIIDFHSLTDYVEIAPTIQFFENEMEKRGVKKEIYIGDAYPMSPLLANGFETCEVTWVSATEFFPVTPANRCKAADLIATLRNSSSPNQQKAKEWEEKNVAIGLTRKFVVAAGEGAIGINVGNLEDWPQPFGCGLCSTMGLMDTIYPGGESTIGKRIPLDERSGFYAAKMISQLQGFTDVKRLLTDHDIYAYQFTVNNKPIVVLWYDNSNFYSLDDETPRKEASIPWKKSSATITEIPTKRGQENGGTVTIHEGDDPVNDIYLADGQLHGRLGYVPVFVT